MPWQFDFLHIHAVLTVIFTLLLISRRRDPAVTLIWVLGFVFLPFLGVVLYLFFGFRRFRNRRRRKPEPAKRASLLFRAKADDAGQTPIPPERQSIEKLAAKLTGFSAVPGNSVTIFDDAIGIYEAIATAIQTARHHVHLEYYVFQPDETGGYIRDRLVQKAREGVECRLLVDAVGSHRLNKSFIRSMTDNGVRVALFWPVNLLRRSWGFHLRNHRKMAVIDGKVGFIGSQNIGNEYLQWRNRRLSWKDTQVRVEGPVVNQLQTIFTEDWTFTTHEPLLGDNYFPEQRAVGTCSLQTLPTGLDEKENALQLILLAAIGAAKKRITITTPYFVPNAGLVLALAGAAHRGVRVDILLPSKSDQPLMVWAGRSWYRELLESGVHIYEYGERFVHAKVVTVDDDLSLVGSANMDIRSFQLNFEASLLIYDQTATNLLSNSFNNVLAKALEVPRRTSRFYPFPRALMEGLSRVLSPLL